MSANSAPISAPQFAAAIKDLPLANLHFKAAEIRNSIAHLESSNQQLRSFADDGDADCKQAIEENIVVMRRMEARIQLLKQEVEGRGFKWGEDEQENRDAETNGNGVDGNAMQTAPPTATGTGQRPIPTGGSLSDEELARRLRERMVEGGDMDEDGVHL